MRNHTTPHPIWQRLRDDGRYNLKWLATQTGFSHSHVKAVAAGIQPAGPRFRAACARVLGGDESVLFHGAPTERAPGDDARTGSSDLSACTATGPTPYHANTSVSSRTSQEALPKAG